MNFPKPRPLAVVFFVGGKRVDEQTFFAVGAQSCVGVKSQAQFGSPRHQVHDFHGELLQLGEIFRFGLRYKNDVEIGTIINFRAAEFAQAYDDKRRGS